MKPEPFSLDNIRRLLARMDHPENKLKFVHLAGTNGKGSTAAFISNIVQEAGYRTGVYTSPFLLRMNECIAVNGSEIEDSQLIRLMELVREKAAGESSEGEIPCSEFELTTALAFQYFYERDCELVVLETGLGGRADATNCIGPPLAAVITAISCDHMAVLGNSLTEIAREKAGIIKPGIQVAAYPQEREAEAVIEAACRAENAVLHWMNPAQLQLRYSGLEGQVFDFAGHEDLRISLLGEHQVKNAALAVKTAEILTALGFSISEEALRLGLAKAHWAGRFEVVGRRPAVIVDGAHNRQGALALAAALRRCFPSSACTFIMGVLADKEYEEMIQAVLPLADRFFTVTPENPRALPAEALAAVLRRHHPRVGPCKDIEEALAAALATTPPDGVICVFGSLYYIGKARFVWQKQAASRCKSGTN